MAIPIITCGNSKPDATGVHGGMEPEYEVIYAGFLLPETLEELPRIVAGKPPASSSLHTQIASNSFTHRPRAIVVGGGYTENEYQALYEALLKACGGSKQNLNVAFFRADNQLTEKLHAEGKGPKKYGEGYAAAVTKRLKDKLSQVGVQNELKEQDVGELFFY